MSIDARVRAYWREEFSLIALLLLFFIAIVAFGYSLPFDARLFPLIIGCAGIVLTLAVALEQVRRRRAGTAAVCRRGRSGREGRLAALCHRAPVGAGIRPAVLAVRLHHRLVRRDAAHPDC